MGGKDEMLEKIIFHSKEFELYPKRNKEPLNHSGREL